MAFGCPKSLPSPLFKNSNQAVMPDLLAIIDHGDLNSSLQAVPVHLGLTVGPKPEVTMDVEAALNP